MQTWHNASLRRIKLGMRIRYQSKKKKKVNGAAAVWILGIACTAFLLQGRKEQLARIAEECKILCYEEILEFYMPGVVYGSTEEKSAKVWEQVLSHFFLLGEESTAVASYDTQVESELSYEAILAREAADENYVDSETGEVVLTGETPDVAGETGVAQEGSAQAQEGTAETQESAAEQSGEADGGQSAVQTGTGLPGAQEKQVTYAREKLNDFDYLMQNFYQVDSTTTIDGSQLNADALLGKDLRLSHDASTPQILIYHTHSQEGYADSVPGDPSDTVVGVGDYLTKILTEQYGLNVIHHKGEYDVGDRDHAYSKAGPALAQILAENPSIEVVIDLHRDGVAETTRLVTDVGGVQMAQVMFFNGLSRTTKMGNIDYLPNPHIADNLAMSFQMQLKAAEYYPGFTRRIYLKGYRYNMHYCPKTLLVEVGAQTNTVQEAMNAMVPLADVLYKVLTGPQ